MTAALRDLEYCVDYLFRPNTFLTSQVKLYVGYTAGVGEDSLESLLLSAATSVRRSIEGR